jgi:glycerol uptake facilitator-like aquaporin
MSALINRAMLVAIIISVVAGTLIATSLSYLVLQPSINNLQKSNDQLQNSLTSTSSKLSSLDSSFTDMQKAYISASLIDDRLGNILNHDVKGTVVNFGNATASDIVIVVKWYSQGTSFHQETITIDSLAGRAMMELSFSYAFSGAADDFQFTVSWK